MVLCIVSILLAVALLRLGEYPRHHRTESQTRMLFAELLQAQTNALYQRRTVRVLLYRDRFEGYSFSRDRGGGAQPLLDLPGDRRRHLCSGQREDLGEPGGYRQKG